MRQGHCFWAALMLAVEESLAAFSGVSPDPVRHSQVIPKAVRPVDGRLPSAIRTQSICRRFWCQSAEKNRPGKRR